MAQSVVTSVGRTTDHIADGLVKEIFKDAAFRKQLQELIRDAFIRTVADLTREPGADDSEAR